MALNAVISQIKPDEIILFGSRARGDHRENSDFDIVVKGGVSDSSLWASLRVYLSEENVTLHKIDLLKFDDLSAEYVENINKEGRKLYG